MTSSALLEVADLVRVFEMRKAGSLFSRRIRLHAVDGVSLHLCAGETLGLVGESGCGKSTLGNLVLGMMPPSSGSIRFKGEELTRVSRARWMSLRQEMQMVFQDPLAALDRRIPVGRQIIEPLEIHYLGAPGERVEKAREMLGFVGLSTQYMGRYPHELSGGQRQRVVIARALILQPSLLVCDEPVSALDVSVQAQVLELFERLQQEQEIGCLFISHDLKVVRYLSDRVAVMYLGRIVETAPADSLFATPSHPYTRALIDAIPQIERRSGRRRTLSGSPPSPVDLPRGCRFQKRCPEARPICLEIDPQLKPLGTPGPQVPSRSPDARTAHCVACHVAHGDG